MVPERTEVYGYAHSHRLSFLSGLATSWVFTVMVALILQRQVIVLVENASRGVSWPTAAYALRRRLDDASFWGMFSVFVAGVLVFRAAMRIECLAPAELHPNRMRWLWILPAAILPTVAYLWYVRDQDQTFWFQGTEAATVMAQRLEGTLVLSVILAAAVIFAVHLSAVGVLRAMIQLRSARNQSIEEPLRRAASLLVSVTAGPQISTAIGWAIYSVFAFLAFVLGWADGRPSWLGNGASDLLKLLLTLVLYGTFFAFVGLFAWMRLAGPRSPMRVETLSAARLHETYPLRAGSWPSEPLYRKLWLLLDRIFYWVTIITVIIPVAGVIRTLAAVLASWEPFEATDRSKDSLGSKDS